MLRLISSLFSRMLIYSPPPGGVGGGINKGSFPYSQLNNLPLTLLLLEKIQNFFAIWRCWRYERSFIMMAQSTRIFAKLDLVIAQITKIALEIALKMSWKSDLTPKMWYFKPKSDHFGHFWLKSQIIWQGQINLTTSTLQSTRCEKIWSVHHG